MTEINKNELDCHYMSPEQLKKMDHYQQISQPPLKSVIWIIKYEIEAISKKHKKQTQNQNCNLKVN